MDKEKKYQCDVCGEWFKTPNALGAHKRHIHKVEIEKVDTNALLDILRDIQAGISELKQKGGEYSMNDTDIKEGFDVMSEGVADGLSVLLKRIDALEDKIIGIEDNNSQAISDGISTTLNKIDNLSPSKGVVNVPLNTEKQVKEIMKEFLPLMKVHGLDVVIKDGKAQIKKVRSTLKKDRGILDFPSDEELNIEEGKLKKAIEKILPSMSKFNLEIRDANIQKKFWLSK